MSQKTAKHTGKCGVLDIAVGGRLQKGAALLAGRVVRKQAGHNVSCTFPKKQVTVY